MESPARIKIPLKAVLINVGGALLCGAGVYGLVDDGATKMHAAVAILLMVAGVGFMGYAMMRIVLRMRESSRGLKR